MGYAKARIVTGLLGVQKGLGEVDRTLTERKPGGCMADSARPSTTRAQRRLAMPWACMRRFPRKQGYPQVAKAIREWARTESRRFFFFITHVMALKDDQTVLPTNLWQVRGQHYTNLAPRHINTTLRSSGQGGHPSNAWCSILQEEEVSPKWRISG